MDHKTPIMEEIKSLMLHFATLEKNAVEALQQGDVKTHNGIVDQIFDLSGESLKLANKEEETEEEDELDGDEIYEVYPRHLYKFNMQIPSMKKSGFVTLPYPIPIPARQNYYPICSYWLKHRQQ